MVRGTKSPLKFLKKIKSNNKTKEIQNLVLRQTSQKIKNNMKQSFKQAILTSPYIGYIYIYLEFFFSFEYKVYMNFSF